MSRDIDVLVQVSGNLTARDYCDAGVETAGIAARVMHGESPASIPFQPFGKMSLIIDPKAAANGLKIPLAVIARAPEGIKD
ncbi:MAG: ABC transporter substrate binding protein [Bryobacteraceae bacterium]